MNLTRNQIFIVSAVIVIVLVFVLMLFGVIPGLQNRNNTQQEIKLTAWGVISPAQFQVVSDGYSQLNPNVKILYTQIAESNYENTIVNALAAGNSPDILMVPNTWIPKRANLLTPIATTQASLNKFPFVIEQDFSANGSAYALPLYIDTLALFYNKDIFDAKSIALLPTTWQDFQAIIPALRETNAQNQIIKAAAAIGGSETSINHASDILNTILMQSGNPTFNSDGNARFNDDGTKAFNFYLQFANPSSPYYTWNEKLPYSTDSFASGKTAMIFDYVSALPALKAKNPLLRIGIASIPQLSGASQPVTTARYWGLAVSKQSRNQAAAWNFILNATTNRTIAENYLKASGKPPALLMLINAYINDPDLGVFARQALTARDWQTSADRTAIFSTMIQNVLSGKLTVTQAMQEATNKLNGQ